MITNSLTLPGLHHVHEDTSSHLKSVLCMQKLENHLDLGDSFDKANDPFVTISKNIIEMQLLFSRDRENWYNKINK
jgi:hypothetical protein